MDKALAVLIKQNHSEAFLIAVDTHAEERLHRELLLVSEIKFHF